MGLYDEVVKLRDKICTVAPSAVISELNNDPWAIAVCCAESYFKTCTEDEPKPTPSTGIFKKDRVLVGIDFTKALYWFSKGCSWSFVAAIFNTTKASVGNMFVRANVDVHTKIDDGVDFTHDTYLYFKALYDSLTVEWEPEEGEEDNAYKTMLADGYSFVDIYIARYGKDAMKSVNNLAHFLSDKLGVAPDYAMRTAQVLTEWYKGRSIMYLEHKFPMSESAVRALLSKCNYVVPESISCLNLRMLQDAMKYYHNPDEHSNVSDDIKTIASKIHASIDVQYHTADFVQMDDTDMVLIRSFYNAGLSEHLISRETGISLDNLKVILERIKEGQNNDGN